MDVLLILLPIALILSFGGLLAFFWALKSGQYDDLEGAAERILFDDEDDEPIRDEAQKRAPTGSGSEARKP